MKRAFEPPELKRIVFAAKDVLTASEEYEGWNPNDPNNSGSSGGNGDEYEGWMPQP